LLRESEIDLNVSETEIKNYTKLKFKELINNLHLAYKYNQKLNTILLVFELALLSLLNYCTTSIEKLSTELNVVELNDLQKFFESNFAEDLLLQIYHNFSMSCMAVTFACVFFLSFENYAYLVLSLSKSTYLCKISDLIKNILIESYKNILKNDETLKRVVNLDDQELHEFVFLYQKYNFDLNQLRESELKGLIRLIPDEVISVPSSIPLAGKTFLGGAIGISELTLELQRLSGKGMSKVIYSLRHELLNKKWILYGAKDSCTDKYPVFTIKSKQIRGAGLYID
jgi:hypothetical protein